MNSREMDAWIDKLPVLTTPRNSDEERAIMELLGSKGLGVLLGLIFGSRQGLYAALSYQNMGDDNGRWRAGVLQGKIQGIELVIQTVRELAVSVEADAKTKEPEHAR